MMRYRDRESNRGAAGARHREPKMNDKITKITIMVFFSAIGAVILVLGWVRPQSRGRSGVACQSGATA